MTDLPSVECACGAPILITHDELRKHNDNPDAEPLKCYACRRPKNPGTLKKSSVGSEKGRRAVRLLMTGKYTIPQVADHLGLQTSTVDKWWWRWVHPILMQRQVDDLKARVKELEAQRDQGTPADLQDDRRGSAPPACVCGAERAD